MKRRGFHLVVAVLAVCLLASTHAFAQGGGASTTGSINGKVADSSGGVLPGVTVTRDQPVGDGRRRRSVTDTGGNYRFPALPPGTYTVTFELPGFNTLKRENIQISLGFTADGERRARGRVAAGDGDGHRRLAGHRHLARRACSRTSSSKRCRQFRTRATCGRCSR